MKYIYIVTFGTQFIKIGVADDVEHRLAELQTGSPLRLRIFDRFRIEDDRLAFKHETAIHRRLKAFTTSGEWFQLPAYEAAAVVVNVISGGPPKDIDAAAYFQSKRAMGRMLTCPYCSHKAWSPLTNKQIWKLQFRCSACDKSFPGRRFSFRTVA